MPDADISDLARLWVNKQSIDIYYLRVAVKFEPVRSSPRPQLQLLR